MERNLFKYIWHHSRREQVGILLLVAISLPFYFLSLNLPKQIVNQGIIDGYDLIGQAPEEQQRSLFSIDAIFGLGGEEGLFEGFLLDPYAYLLALCVVFLSLVMVNGGFKFFVNTFKGQLGERMLRRLRFELTDRVLRFPIPFIRRMKQAEVATMIKDEVEPLGGFIGDAFVTPAFLGGQALTAMLFIMVQNLWLGLVAAAIVLFQAILIPKLRRRILDLGRQRQLTARKLAGRVAEIVDGAIEIQAHDTTNYERADMTKRLGEIYDIRFEIFQRKFFVKFLNNLLSQFTPFIFYSAGGVLVISGRLDVGALVAVIAAYKDLPGPIKELIDWDQRRNDVQIKYDQVIDQFQPPMIIAPELQDPGQDSGPTLSGKIEVNSLTLEDDNNTKLVEGVSFDCDVGDHVAIVGPSGSGKDHLSMMLSGLIPPTSGGVKIGGRNLHDLPSAVTGRRLSYIGPNTYFFPVSVRDNLLFGLKHRPLREAEYDSDGKTQRTADVAEALRAGNSDLDYEADWVEYAAAGASGPDEINVRMIQILKDVGLEDDIYRLGLSGTIDADAHPEVAQGILLARSALSDRLASEDAEDLVVRFDPGAYNRNATLAENLLFGTPTNPIYGTDALAQNPLMLQVLKEKGLTDVLLDMGYSIAKTMVEIFADLPSGHPFFEQFSFIEADDLPEFTALIARGEKSGRAALNETEQGLLLNLPFKYIEERHRLGLIDPEVERKLVEGRQRFSELLLDQDPGAVAFYRPESYNAAASIQDNILFGRLVYGQAQAAETIGRVMSELLEELGLRQRVIEAGLDFNVGIAGSRLSIVQRQKLGFARCLLKQPDVLIVNEAAAGMDSSTQTRLLETVLHQRRGKGVLWTLQHPRSAELFDHVLVMRAGRVAEQGSFAELTQPGSALSALLAAE
ncbi:ATP-binding cassette domain-containing protein [Denitrobaculum tricleocarpae]|uniref:ATP-binding cassette domain-containing protein n=1 Tax=Denitrobaculum tricleocarpae TaxID=2591009 RepID=A0A545TRE7_9PROT|nr:ATP-binding cassette domain-containing protein [Denitrobaculum tricleocarpae]TQV79793.1 ATP-binding cassette domain-containing protein [Denitrobaculum tricleocarpae]